MKPPRKGSRGPLPRSVADRVVNHIVIDDNGCHIWTGSLDTKGRPQMQHGSTADGTRRPRRVHNLLWNEANGPPPAGYDVHHKCEVILCVNLDHFKLLKHGKHSAHHSSEMTPESRSNRARHAQHV